MSTATERYEAATKYIGRAIATVERPPLSGALFPPLAAIEAYAGSAKTQTARNDLARIEARWLRATTEEDRARIARDAELLADRVQESLPGAPQDRARTNLYKGEVPTATPTTSYAQEVGHQAEEVWHWAKDTAAGVGHGVQQVGKWLLVGGGLLLAIKAVDLIRTRQQRDARRVPTRRLLNASLVRAAERAERRAGR